MSPKRKAYAGFYEQHPPLPQDERAHRLPPETKREGKRRVGDHHPPGFVEAGVFMDRPCSVRCELCDTERRVDQPLVLGPCTHCGGSMFQVRETH